MKQIDAIKQSPLGKASDYIDQYTPSLLYPIARNKQALFANDTIDAYGVDIWNAYEVSWLNAQGIPQMAMAEFRIPFHSPAIVESKSFKLYLNSFNQTLLASQAELQTILQQDLSQAVQAQVQVTLFGLHENAMPIMPVQGVCVDEQPVTCVADAPDALLLQVDSNTQRQEVLYSELLKSNCPVTGQPDWATVVVEYQGAAIDYAGLLAYIISYRQHGDFHEQCVEQIFLDVWQQCQPQKLCVYARYLRRGGLDINPYRASYPITPVNHRTQRQ